MEPVSADLTSLLKKLADGNQEAADELIPVIYQQLHRLAVAHLLHERPNHTLQPTALVHEAYIKLVAQRKVDWQSRSHLFAVASELMRRMLVDYARRQSGPTGVPILVVSRALVLGMSATTVRREWTSAKAWLYEKLIGGHGDHA